MKRIVFILATLFATWSISSCDLIESLGSDDQTATITLSGTIASNPQISASSEGLWFGVSFTATGSWEITSVDDESSQRAEWISFSCDNGDQGDATTTIYIEQNDSGAARSAIVKFTAQATLLNQYMWSNLPPTRASVAQSTHWRHYQQMVRT